MDDLDRMEKGTNRMKKMLALAGMLAVAASAVACGGDGCKDLGDKLNACGADPAGAKTVDCNDEEQTCAACLTDCLNSDCTNMTGCASGECFDDCNDAPD